MPAAGEGVDVHLLFLPFLLVCIHPIEANPVNIGKRCYFLCFNRPRGKSKFEHDPQPADTGHKSYGSCINCIDYWLIEYT